MDENLPKRPALSAGKAHRAQRRMSELLILEDQLPRKTKYITGSHGAYTKKNTPIAASVVLECDAFELREIQTASCKTHLPHIPTCSPSEKSGLASGTSQNRLQSNLFPVNGRGFVHSHNFELARHPADSRLKTNQGWKDVTETVNKTENQRKTRKT